MLGTIGNVSALETYQISAQPFVPFFIPDAVYFYSFETQTINTTSTYNSATNQTESGAFSASSNSGSNWSVSNVSGTKGNYINFIVQTPFFRPLPVSLTRSNGITMCFWMKCSITPAPGVYFDLMKIRSQLVNSNKGYGFQMFLAPPTPTNINYPFIFLFFPINAQTLDSNSVTFTSNSLANRISNGNWRHIAVTIDGNGQFVDFYLDGTTNITTGTITKSNTLTNATESILQYPPLQYGGFSGLSSALPIQYDEIGLRAAAPLKIKIYGEELEIIESSNNCVKTLLLTKYKKISRKIIDNLGNANGVTINEIKLSPH
jgi:hypothetical protein